MVLGILLGIILRSDIRGSAHVCLPLIVWPLIQGFEVVVGLVRFIDKLDLGAMILVTNFQLYPLFRFC